MIPPILEISYKVIDYTFNNPNDIRSMVGLSPTKKRKVQKPTRTGRQRTVSNPSTIQLSNSFSPLACNGFNFNGPETPDQQTGMKIPHKDFTQAASTLHGSQALRDAVLGGQRLIAEQTSIPESENDSREEEQVTVIPAEPPAGPSTGTTPAPPPLSITLNTYNTTNRPPDNQ